MKLQFKLIQLKTEYQRRLQKKLKRLLKMQCKIKAWYMRKLLDCIMIIILDITIMQ